VQENRVNGGKGKKAEKSSLLSFVTKGKEGATRLTENFFLFNLLKIFHPRFSGYKIYPLFSSHLLHSHPFFLHLTQEHNIRARREGSFRCIRTKFGINPNLSKGITFGRKRNSLVKPYN
jgi:hypothetical protein